jgi:hypothetical protein
MAFEARTKELKERFDFFKTTLKPEDFMALGGTLETILKAREDGLKALSEILADKGDNARNDAYSSKLDDLSKSQLDKLQNLLQYMKEQPPNLIAFRDIAANEEQRFWNGLKTCKAGEARDAQMKAMHDLEWFTTIMRARWKNLSDTEQELLKKERYFAAQLRETVKKAFDEAASDGALAARDTLTVLTLPDELKKRVNARYKEIIKSVASSTGTDSKKIEEFLKKLEQARSSIKDAAKEVGLPDDVVDKFLQALTSPRRCLRSFRWPRARWASWPRGPTGQPRPCCRWCRRSSTAR